MSILWGSPKTSKINDISLEHSIIELDFLISAEIMHQSIVNEVRTWSKKNDYIDAMVTLFLYKYADPAAKALSLLAVENTVVSFTFGTDGELTLNMYLESVDIRPLHQPWNKDIAILTLKGTDFIHSSTRRIVTKAGKFIKTADGKYLTTKGIIP